MHSAIFAATETLRHFLQARLDATPDIVALGPTVVSGANAQQMIDGNLRGVSVWLYRVVRDEEMVNAPPERLDAFTWRHPPLPLRLHYLVTPVGDASPIVGPQVEQLVLGRVLQALSDEPRFTGSGLQGTLAGTAVELIARLEPLTIDELTRVWDALDIEYRLSVSYEVTIVDIRSERVDRVVPVQTVVPEVGVVVASEGP